AALQTFLHEVYVVLETRGCAYLSLYSIRNGLQSLTPGTANRIFDDEAIRTHVLDYLLTEIQALRMLKYAQETQSQEEQETKMSDGQPSMSESMQMAASMVTKPPESVTAQRAMEKEVGIMAETMLGQYSLDYSTAWKWIPNIESEVTYIYVYFVLTF